MANNTRLSPFSSFNVWLASPVALIGKGREPAGQRKRRQRQQGQDRHQRPQHGGLAVTEEGRRRQSRGGRGEALVRSSDRFGPQARTNDSHQG